MRIPPRYGPHPLVTYEGDPAAVAAPAIRQRRRLAATLAGFGPHEWNAPSRCAGWTNRDVVAHLASTNRFWVHSIGEGRRGAPTRLLAGFDPVATPAELVAAAGDQSVDEVLESYVRSTDALVDLLRSLAVDEWTMLGESPLGHVSLSGIVRHALWDAWVHERDIAYGLDLAPPVVADEVDVALRHAAALGPALGILLGDLVGGPFAATVTTVDPAVGFTVEVDTAVRVAGVDPAAPVAVRGTALDVLEGLSLRGPLAVEPDCHWLVAGLRQSFEAVPAD